MKKKYCKVDSENNIYPKKIVTMLIAAVPMEFIPIGNGIVLCLQFSVHENWSLIKLILVEFSRT